MRPISIISTFIAAAGTLLAAEQDDPRFAQWMEYSRTEFGNNHLIANLKLESIDGKARSAEYRFDRYPGKVERIQSPSGLAYARKEGKKWVESEDWGESGKPAKKERVAHLDDWVDYVDLPLRKEKPEPRDKSQGAVVVRLVDQHPSENGDEEFVFERGREKQTGVNYPRFTFLKYKNSKPEEAILYKFSGPIYTADGRVQLIVQYGLMVAVKMNVVTPTPASENSAPPSENSLPPPVSEKTYTFQGIEKEKGTVKDKVVKIEILKLVGGPSDLMGNGTFRFIAKDTSNGAAPYGQVAFPPEGLKKMGLANDPHREGPFTVYARIHLFSEKKAAAISEVVGTHVSIENGKATYSW
jgi:hypothetical protein